MVGKGKRVDLAAAAASLLRTTMPSSQDSSQSHDGLSEPRLKFIHVLESLECVDNKISFPLLASVIGQFFFKSPPVFNYFFVGCDLPESDVDITVARLLQSCSRSWRS